VIFSAYICAAVTQYSKHRAALDSCQLLTLQGLAQGEQGCMKVATYVGQGADSSPLTAPLGLGGSMILADGADVQRSFVDINLACTT
jgi:hypothetical protein